MVWQTVFHGGSSIDAGSANPIREVHQEPAERRLVLGTCKRWTHEGKNDLRRSFRVTVPSVAGSKAAKLCQKGNGFCQGALGIKHDQGEEALPRCFSYIYKVSSSVSCTVDVGRQYLCRNAAFSCHLIGCIGKKVHHLQSPSRLDQQPCSSSRRRTAKPR